MAVGAGFVAMALALAACSSSSSSSSTSSSTSSASSTGSASNNTSLSGTLLGSGSTFQTVFQQQAISNFKSVDPGITVNYGGGGSGKGRTDLANGTVNYAGSDSPIPATETANFKGKTVLYFPVLVGAITMAYNLSGVSNLKLTPTVISGIFQGQITKWNDPAITAINPGTTLPSTAITVAVRSDSSGTTQNFSLFLVDSVGSAWKLGSSSTIKWPSTARAGAGNAGVAQVVQSTPGAIGYVDYATAKASNLSVASVKNSSGAYVSPSSAAASAAAAGVTVKSNLTFHAVWGSGAAAYPITYQSWDLVYASQSTANDASLLKAYLGYLLGAGQQILTGLGYAPLPSSIDQRAVAQLSQITG